MDPHLNDTIFIDHGDEDLDMEDYELSEELEYFDDDYDY
jgi:hypothetical protein